MKLATLKDSTRDGKLVVVSKDLTRCSEVGHIARTLQAALDDWMHVAPRLERVAIGLETGAQPTMRFHEHDAASPLPRGFFWAGGSGHFSAPRDPLTVSADLTVTTQLAVISDDVGVGANEESAVKAVVLVLLASDVMSNGEIVTTAFSPVAVTPDELGKGTGLALQVRLGGKALPSPTGTVAESSGSIMQAVKSRSLTAGSIVATGICMTSSPLSSGDTIRVEMNDHTGHSIFGAIERTVASESQ